jgi:excisionase family DNA binding protein
MAGSLSTSKQLASTPPSGPRFISVVETRGRLGNIGRSTFYRWLDSGVIKTVRICGRRLVPESEILRLLAEGGSEGD